MNSQTPSEAGNYHQIYVRNDYLNRIYDDNEVSDISIMSIIIDMMKKEVTEVILNDLTFNDCHNMECLQLIYVIMSLYQNKQRTNLES